ncbi:MAG: desulfoferrodoxin family protein [Bacillota bacterium]|nr:desulfoferrodoxin family protein [Bacillota bacterium]
MLSNTVMSGDFKNEKHVPVIQVQKAVKGEEVKVKLSVGEEIGHPNTFEHHIAWFKLFYQPEGFPKPVEVSTVNFSAHGEGEIFTSYEAEVSFKAEKNGKLFALSYCNIHGLWESEVELVLE